jgi:DNA-directed RNA polymerase specialized sigma24 family protein
MPSPASRSSGATALAATRRSRRLHVVVDAAGADVLEKGERPLVGRLSPLERASFLLHDVFGLEFAEVARALGGGEAAC